MFCQKCGTQVNENDNVCFKCGNILNSEPVAQQPVYEKPKKAKKPFYKKWWVWTIAAILLLVIWIGNLPSDSTTTSNSASDSTVASQSTPKISEADYKSQCKTLKYKDIARTPDKYVGEKATFKGNVIQAVENGNDVTLRVDVTAEEFSTDSDIIFVNYTKKKSNEPRILENDTIELWGNLNGIKTYKSTLGAQISIPQLDLEYYSIVEETNSTTDSGNGTDSE